MPSSRFKQWTDKDIVDLIEAYPLALVVTASDGPFRMTPLPMLADTDADGRLVRLVGHMALSNEHTAVLRSHPRAQFLFLGPHGYVSPRLLDDRSWAPTWNYVVVRVEADVVFQPDKLDEALRRLVARLEGGKPDAWSVEELGERYAQLARRIVAFDAEVRAVDATFKLGQDEQPEVFRQIVAGLESAELREWMQRFSGGPA
jgi:transcriptional regulator